MYGCGVYDKLNVDYILKLAGDWQHHPVAAGEHRLQAAQVRDLRDPGRAGLAPEAGGHRHDLELPRLPQHLLLLLLRAEALPQPEAV